VATRSKISGEKESQFWDVDETRGNARTIDEGVEDGHGAVGDTSVGMHLLED
jgi:hypothetical protein